MDVEVLAMIEQARAAWQKKTSEPGYVEPEPFVGPGRRKPPPPAKEEMTVVRAFDLLLRSNAVLERAKGAATAHEVMHIWQDYSHDYIHLRLHPLPAERIAECQLSVLHLRDVFNDAKRYVGRKVHIRSAPEKRRDGSLESLADILRSAATPAVSKPAAEPFGLIVDTARRQAKRVKDAGYDKTKAVKFLQQNGYDNLEACDESELRHMRWRANDAEMYPRTYL